MKPRLPIVLPLRGSRARLPFLLVPVLAGMAVLQLAWPERTDLPPGGSVAHIGPGALPETPAEVIAPPVLASRDLFARPASHGGPDSTSDPLDGAVIAGVVQKGRLRLGIVQQAGGQVRYIGVGGDVAGWRLAALDQAGARLTHGPGQNLAVPYGLHPTPVKPADVPAMASAPSVTDYVRAVHAPQFGSVASPQMLERGQ